MLLRPVIMRGGLACGHRVSPHGRTVSFVSLGDDIPNRGKVGPVDNFCVSDTKPATTKLIIKQHIKKLLDPRGSRIMPPPGL